MSQRAFDAFNKHCALTGTENVFVCRARGSSPRSAIYVRTVPHTILAMPGSCTEWFRWTGATRTLVVVSGDGQAEQLLAVDGQVRTVHLSPGTTLTLNAETFDAEYYTRIVTQGGDALLFRVVEPYDEEVRIKFHVPRRYLPTELGKAVFERLCSESLCIPDFDGQYETCVTIHQTVGEFVTAELEAASLASALEKLECVVTSPAATQFAMEVTMSALCRDPAFAARLPVKLTKAHLAADVFRRLCFAGLVIGDSKAAEDTRRAIKNAIMEFTASSETPGGTASK